MKKMKIKIFSTTRTESMPISVMEKFLPGMKVTLIRTRALDPKTKEPTGMPIEGMYKIDLGDGKIINEKEAKIIQIVMQKKEEIFDAFGKAESIEFEMK